jgi:hypothetical protein
VHMADLNLRGIDPELKAQLKAEAAVDGVTLHVYVSALLRNRSLIVGSSKLGGVGVAATPSVSKTESAGSSPAAPAKPTAQVLRERIESALQPVGDDEGAWENLELPPCSACEAPMRNVKGKWACAAVSCGMYGKEQRIKR